MLPIHFNSLEPNSRAITKTALDLSTLRIVLKTHLRSKREFRPPCLKQGFDCQPVKLRTIDEASWSTSRIYSIGSFSLCILLLTQFVIPVKLQARKRTKSALISLSNRHGSAGRDCLQVRSVVLKRSEPGSLRVPLITNYRKIRFCLSLRFSVFRDPA